MAGLSFDGLPRTVCVPLQTLMKVQLTAIIPRALIASIRFLADFPCPHCLVLKSQIGDLGSADDMERRENVRKYPATAVKRARKRIFENGGSVNYRGVNDELTETGSWVPTEASSICTAPLSTPDDQPSRTATMCHWGYSRLNCSPLTSCTISRSGCSNGCSPISSGSYTL